LPNHHYSGVYGLLKLTLPALLPSALDRVVVLDTDVALATDLCDLWRQFEHFPSHASLGLVENQSDWYLPVKLWWRRRPPWPALKRGFNTGVILMRLDRLRAMNWSTAWRAETDRLLVTSQHLSTQLADQDVFNAVVAAQPDLAHKLSCEWNLQFSDHSNSRVCRGRPRIFHFNSLSKGQERRDERVAFYRRHLLIFQQMDGAHFQPIAANSSNAAEKLSDETECEVLNKTRFTTFR